MRHFCICFLHLEPTSVSMRVNRESLPKEVKFKESFLTSSYSLFLVQFCIFHGRSICSQQNTKYLYFLVAFFSQGCKSLNSLKYADLGVALVDFCVRGLLWCRLWVGFFAWSGLHELRITRATMGLLHTTHLLESY